MSKRDENNGLAARALMLGGAATSPEYWDAFMQRARQPLGWGVRYGDAVPGLSAYINTQDAMNSAQAGNYGDAALSGAAAAAEALPGIKAVDTAATAMAAKLARALDGAPQTSVRRLRRMSEKDERKWLGTHR